MSVTISTKVPEQLDEQIEAAGEEGESKSATVRRLIRAGLRSGEKSPHAVSLPILLMWFGSVAASAQYATASGALGPAGLVALLLGILLTRESITSRLKALRTSLPPSKEDTG
ncbi:hypothetical protein DVK02_15075 [Halobellus sp. Atlit-31R]|nr:hypothetical protein DVK02_15075 [Halobellus sp. Atlit-31R]